MHEFSLSSQIWASVQAAAQGRRVLSITLELGALTLLAEDQVRFWVESLAARDGSPEVKVTITYLPARVRCQACGEEGEAGLPAGELDHYLPPPVCCAKCGATEVEVIGGRETRVVRAELRTGSDAGCC